MCCGIMANYTSVVLIKWDGWVFRSFIKLV